MKSKKSRKQIKKLANPICFFCGETNYALLDSHRIAWGALYNEHNMLVVCANDHRRIHAGEIIIDRKYNSTYGPVVHYFIDGVEYWKKEFHNFSQITS